MRNFYLHYHHTELFYVVVKPDKDKRHLLNVYAHIRRTDKISEIRTFYHKMDASLVIKRPSRHQTGSNGV